MFGLDYKSRKKLSFLHPELNNLVWLPYVPMLTIPIIEGELISHALITSHYSITKINNNGCSSTNN